MTRHRHRLVIAFALVLGCRSAGTGQAASEAGASAPPAQIITRLERIIPPLMRDGEVPGLAVALVHDGQIVWHRGFGVKNSRTNDSVDDSTVFEAASLSKPVFAYAVLQLVDSGRLDLDHSLDDYLPGAYATDGDPRLHQITARRVLSHTTGFPNWRSGDTLRMYFAPGERFSYSGEGYVYLARVVERITGEPLNDFVTRTVFRPLGMTHSSYLWRPEYDQATTWYHNTRGEPAMRRPSPDVANPAASLRTTAADYGRFVVAVLRGAELKAETRRAMSTTQSQVLEGGSTTINRPHARPFPGVTWGLGWGLQATPEGSSLWHWGNNGDAKAYVVARERDRSGIVILTNSTYGLSIVPEIVEASLGGAQPALSWLQVESYRSPGRQLFRRLVAGGNEGAERALADYRVWRRGQPDSAWVTEDQMNRFGLDLLRMQRVGAAVAVLAQNVADHPQSFNVYDSLGEAYAVAGDTELAISNYQRSVAINPRNTGGIEALKRLRGRR